MHTLLRPHFESTFERLRSHPVILAVQDTTTLNYTAHPPEGVDPINTSENSAVGLVLHDTLVFTPVGTPLGLLNVQCWARDPECSRMACVERLGHGQHGKHWIGKPGGWLARGKQDNPGTTCMWRGLVRLPTIVQGYLLALQVHGIRVAPDLQS
jgi:hypothetical protein